MTARPSTDVFRPCLPLDPFAPLDLGPWRPSISPHADAPNAVLVLGDPAHTDLYPLLYSQSLTRAIVVLATHAPPHIPQTPSSAVRILRLSAPLAQDLSALRLVSLIERADRVVRRFRASGAEQSRKLVQLAEDDLTSEFVAEEPYSASYSPPHGHRQQHLASEEVPRYPSPAPSETSSVSSFSSTLSHSSSSVFSAVSSAYPSHRRRSRAPPSSGPPADRAFDAIINFLPTAVPDKVLLKHAILVSTLTASFFAAPPMPSPPSSYSKPKNLKHRSSIFSNFAFSSSDAQFAGSVTEGSPAVKKNPRRFSALLRRQQDSNGHTTSELVQSAPCSRDSLPLTTSASHLKGKSRSHQPQVPENQRKAHLIHILPAHVYSSSLPTGASGSNGKSKKHQQRKPKPKLVQSIEQFLLAFGYPLQSMSLLPSAPASAPASRRISTDSAFSTFMSASVSGDAVGQEKPIPFLLPASVFGSVPHGGKLSIGEILLMGGLDTNEKKEKVEEVNGMSAGMGMDGMGVGGEGRVWIASPEDVAWDDLTSLSINPTRDGVQETGSLSTRYIQMPAPSVAPPAAANGWRSSSSPLPAPLATAAQLRTVPHAQSQPQLQLFSPPPAASRNSTLNFAPTPVLSSAPSSKAAVPSKPGKLGKRSSYAATEPNKGYDKSKERREQQQLPTPPESSSGLEDEVDSTFPVTPSTSTHEGSVSGYATSLANTLGPGIIDLDGSVSDHHHHHHHHGVKGVGAPKFGKLTKEKGGKRKFGFGRALMKLVGVGATRTG